MFDEVDEAGEASFRKKSGWGPGPRISIAGVGNSERWRFAKKHHGIKSPQILEAGSIKDGVARFRVNFALCRELWQDVPNSQHRTAPRMTTTQNPPNWPRAYSSN